MQTTEYLEIAVIVLLIVVIAVLFLTRTKEDENNDNDLKNKNHKEEIKKSDLIAYIRDIYSKYFSWNDGISIKSAHVAGKKEFAKKLLDNIDNEEEFLKIYNSDYIKSELLNIELDKKYDEIEKLYGVPLDFVVDFDKFNIKDGTLIEKIQKLAIEWYREGVNEVKGNIKYEVASKDWDRVKNSLERIYNY